jgi:DNA invertase Pin-like site-specific DNA recombinase
MRVITYRRVSTEEQADSGLGLDAQATALDAELAHRDGWTVIAEMVDEGLSARAKTMHTRPGLSQAIDMLARGEADVLIAAKLDRITRSVADLATLMDDAVRQGWSLVAVDNRDIDMTTATGRLFANIMGSVSQWEREIIGERTKAALAELRAKGVRLGRPVEQDDIVRRRIADMHAAGEPLLGIARTLNADGTPTARGGRWHASTVSRVLKSVALDEQAGAVRANLATVAGLSP